MLARARKLAVRVGRWVDLRIALPTITVGLLVLGVGLAQERRSCERTVAARSALTRFATYQGVFQHALSRIEQPDERRVEIVDPDTGERLRFTRAELRRWVQNKQARVIGELRIPDCTQLLPET